MLDDTKCYYSWSLILNCLDKMWKLRQFKLYHVCLFIDICDICERTANQFEQKILSQNKYCSKKVLFGWSEGTALIDSFGPYIYTLCNDNNFSSEGYT